jgi:hypothetical protein
MPTTIIREPVREEVREANSFAKRRMRFVSLGSLWEEKRTGEGWCHFFMISSRYSEYQSTVLTGFEEKCYLEIFFCIIAAKVAFGID